MSEKSLKKIKKSNKMSSFSVGFLNVVEKEVKNKTKERIKIVEIEKPWGDDDFILLVDYKKIKEIENIIFLRSLIAIYHKNDSKIEFIFDCIEKELYDKVKNIKFTIPYERGELFCYFRRPSEQVWILSEKIITFQNPDNSSYRNLVNFHKYINRNDFEEQIKSKFDDLYPVNFFVELNGLDLKGKDSVELNEKFKNIAKYLNFYIQIFDHEMPYLHIYEEEHTTSSNNNYKTYSNSIPYKINAKPINETLLELYNYTLTNRRNLLINYLYFYQILEYLADYFVPTELRQNIENVLIKPSIYNEKKEITNEIISFFSEYNKLWKNETNRINKLIKYYCDLEEIWKEVELNKKIFSEKNEFYGGFSIKEGEFIGENINKEEFVNGKYECLTGILVKIRNAIVHFKESRKEESIIICDKNNKKIIPYLHLIRRVVESIIIRYDIS